MTDLSPDIAELIRQGWRPVYNKRWGRWYLQTSVTVKDNYITLIMASFPLIREV